MKAPHHTSNLFAAVSLAVVSLALAPNRPQATATLKAAANGSAIFQNGLVRMATSRWASTNDDVPVNV